MQLKVIPRKTWANGFVDLQLGWRLTNSQPVAISPAAIVVHHMEPDNQYNSMPHSLCAARLRHWFIIHISERGWSDIGYHLIICPHGEIFEGRDGGVEEPIQGAHAFRNNDQTLGIALLGNFHIEAPSDASQKALREVLKWCCQRYEIRPQQQRPWQFTDKSGKQHEVQASSIVGHRDLKPTICPGDALYKIITDFNLRAF